MPSSYSLSRHPSSVAALRHGERMDTNRSSLGEFTRRLLREEGVELLLPSSIIEIAEPIVGMVSRHIPARILLPDVNSHPFDYVSLMHEKKEIGRLGGMEPSLEIVWVEGEIQHLIQSVIELVEEFLAAGYPGCRDCIGPAASEPWDESRFR
jgi:hypothetical protein